MSNLAKAIRSVMSDAVARSRHPEGMTALDVLDEIRAATPGAFPLVSWLDVYDEMRNLYGEPRRKA